MFAIDFEHDERLIFRPGAQFLDPLFRRFVVHLEGRRRSADIVIVDRVDRFRVGDSREPGPERIHHLVSAGDADFVAPHFDPGANLVANLAHRGQLFGVRSGQRGRIGKAPVQARRRTGKDRTFLRAALITNGHDISEDRARFPDVENALGSFLRNVDARPPTSPRPRAD